MNNNLSIEDLKKITKGLLKLSDEINQVTQKRDALIENLQSIAKMTGLQVNENKLAELKNEFQDIIDSKTKEMLKLQEPLDILEKIN